MAPGWVNGMFKSLFRDGKRRPELPGQETGSGPEPGAEALSATAPGAAAGGTVAPDDEPPGTASLRFTWHGVTDPGRVRPRNEDSFSCVTTEGWSLFVVADGMGGHDAGEVASKIAAETVCREIEAGMQQGVGGLLELVEDAVQRANSAVHREGASKGSNMGTTLSLALVRGSTALIASVGDSRVYWAENGSLTQITQDHSLVASLVAAGELTKEGARNHPRSNILYRTVGRPERIAVDTFEFVLKRGGVLLLCTDGLWGEVGDEELARALAASEDVRVVGERLVETANAHGGKDNITAVVVAFA